jgi:chromosome segregation ATPase
MTTMDEAIATRDDLRAKLDDVRLQLEALDEARKEIAFEAHTAGGEAAKQLCKMNKQRTELIGDIESLEAAHIEASRRVDAAEREAAARQSEADARAAIEAADKLISMGEELDAAFARVAEMSKEFWSQIETLKGLKCGQPAYQAYSVQCALAAQTHLMHSTFNRHLAPHERRSFSELAHGWRRMAINSVRAHLPAEAAE